jgi:hypothetical protein
MIENYVNKLTNTVNCSQKIIEIDLLLSGGAFNGSYILGALYYLKNMEEKKFIKIRRISSSSIGSILGLLYLTDNLDLFNDFYKIIFNQLKKRKNLSQLLDLKNMLNDKLPNNICELLNNKYYVCYNNIKLCKKIIKCKYENKEQLIDYIIRSCYVPYLIDYKPCYKNKYIDGMLPYFFNKKHNRQILYINVFTPDKLYYVINVKNETINLHRILSGINDIHMFFIKNENTLMCSYLNYWYVYEYTIYYLSYIIECIILYLLYWTKSINNQKIIKQCFKNMIRFLLKKYLL